MEALLYSFVLLLPLFFLPWANQQFELAKFLLILTVAGLILLHSAYKAIKDKVRLAPARGLILAGGALLAYLILHSLFLSVVPDNSIWGSYQRHTGVVLWLALAVIFWKVATHKWTQESLGMLLRLMAVTGAVVSVVGMVQLLEPQLWGSLGITNGRIFSTMGVPNFLGQWLLMTLVLTAYQLKQATSWSHRMLWVMALLPQVLALIFTQNRASLLVLGILILGSALVLFFRMRATWQKGALASLFLMLLIALGYGMMTRSDGPWRSVQSRMLLYPMAVQAMLERPQGYGLDTLYTAFAPRLPTNLGETENLQDVPDKVHQAVLDTINETGIIGLVLMLWFWFEVLRLGLRQLRDPLARGRAGAILTALTAWLLTLLVSFPGVTERAFAAVLLGILAIPLLQSAKEKKPSEVHRWGSVLSFGTAGVLLLLLAAGTLTADLHFARLMQSTDRDALPQLTRMTPMHLEYKIFGSNGMIPSVSTQTRIDLLQEALKRNPHDVWAWTFLADAQAQKGDYPAAKDALAKARSTCEGCIFVAVQGAKIANNAEDQEAVTAWVVHYMELLPSFVMADPASLSPEQQERRRITLKEQKADLAFMMSLLGGREEEILKKMR